MAGPSPAMTAWMGNVNGAMRFAYCALRAEPKG
jgi:hypothetical protein